MQKIKEVLQGICSPKDNIHVFEEDEQSLHVFIVSRKLSRMRPGEQGELIWSELFRELSPKEWGQVTLTRVLSPREADGVAPERLRFVL